MVFRKSNYIYLFFSPFYSVSAQSSFAIGAILNATFGSGVELILYTVLMVKGINDDTLCYNELVRSGLAGKLYIYTVNIGKIQVPKNIAAVILKLEQCGLKYSKLSKRCRTNGKQCRP